MFIKHNGLFTAALCRLFLYFIECVRIWSLNHRLVVRHQFVSHYCCRLQIISLWNVKIKQADCNTDVFCDPLMLSRWEKNKLWLVEVRKGGFQLHLKTNRVYCCTCCLEYKVVLECTWKYNKCFWNHAYTVLEKENTLNTFFYKALKASGSQANFIYISQIHKSQICLTGFLYSVERTPNRHAIVCAERTEMIETTVTLKHEETEWQHDVDRLKTCMKRYQVKDRLQTDDMHM